MDVIEAFKKTKEVQQQYDHYSLEAGPPISLDDLVHIVSEYAEVNIELIQVGYDSKDILARLLRYDEKAKIEFAADLNYCHRRYGVTKELAQLIIDTEDTFTMDFAQLVAGLVDDSFQQISGALESESIAHYVACELLMPFEMRKGYIQALDEGKITFYKIADRHKMPESKVRSILHKPVQSALSKIMLHV